MHKIAKSFGRSDGIGCEVHPVMTKELRARLEELAKQLQDSIDESLVLGADYAERQADTGTPKYATKYAYAFGTLDAKVSEVARILLAVSRSNGYNCDREHLDSFTSEPGEES